MLNELRGQVLAYSSGASSLDSFSTWISSIDWSTGGGMSPEEREVLGRFELLVTEVEENLRDEGDLQLAVLNWLATLGDEAGWAVRLPAVELQSGSTTVRASPSWPPAPESTWTDILFPDWVAEWPSDMAPLERITAQAAFARR